MHMILRGAAHTSQSQTLSTVTLLTIIAVGIIAKCVVPHERLAPRPEASPCRKRRQGSGLRQRESALRAMGAQKPNIKSAATAPATTKKCVERTIGFINP